MMTNLDELKGPRYANVKDRNDIIAGIAAGRKIQFVTYALPDIMEHQLDFVIAAILKKFQKSHLQSTVYTCVKELVINATRANARQAWFHEKQIDVSNPDISSQHTEQIKAEISEDWIQKYGSLARDAGYMVSIDFEYDTDGMRIWIWNEVNLNSLDEKRIRERFKEGMAYEDIVSFYMEKGDQSQGEGMGLVMNLLLLKGEGIEPALLRIGRREGRTMARLEVPFVEQFISVRGPNPHGYDHEAVGMRLDYRDNNA
ncbi:MAG: hypothetical protein KDK39_02795 [Leptospiraceae bacterium]|nr:hypothetical protein [Leptospiraceae bacterium]